MAGWSDDRPGLNPQRLLRLIRQSIDECRLALDGLTLLTEAASGAYKVTPIIAALAGSREVIAIARSSRYGAAEDIVADTRSLAALAGCEDRLTFVSAADDEMLGRADIVTNSGNVRPITAAMIGRLKAGAVIPLMYEAWEFRQTDLDLEACRKRGVPVAGTEETHPAVDVFSFLGIMAATLLLRAGVAVYRCRVLLLCDNPFRTHIVKTLTAAGAVVDCADSAASATLNPLPYDAVVIAMHPRSQPVFGRQEAALIAAHSPGAVLAQFWGDVDREAVAAANLAITPADPPPAGHMGILPSGPGPEAIVRLQAGGLKVGEVLHKRSWERDREEARFIQML